MNIEGIAFIIPTIKRCVSIVIQIWKVNTNGSGAVKINPEYNPFKTSADVAQGFRTQPRPSNNDWEELFIGIRFLRILVPVQK